ncbi:hypothetical protein JY651_31450 [Pyxidicoccus parkwayensis]|uniref:AMIN domain-containing protein n=1 Tax=Pyxidicoccus parkwayensis TaxID=2813578 RepID=A0ABX7NMB6_9BACT|nr:hypothetical protein [Pyxidicoccus parkwaysis]QSQ19788.1 hypothetical protein JY651_31450 [Pyxidicoccus parkwaysis]
MRSLLPVGGALLVVLALISGPAVAQPSQVATPSSAAATTPAEPVNAFKQISSASNQTDNHVFTIPAGKRLVIDYVSAKGEVPAGDSVSDIHLNNPVVHFFVVSTQGTDINGKSVFSAAQSLHVTLGPFPRPTDVVVRMERRTFGPGNEATLAVSLAGSLLTP